MRKIVCYFDGACGPCNPGGDVGLGVIIYDVTDHNVHISKMGIRTPPMPYWKELFSYSKSYRSYELGETSNNVAEYMAFHEAAVWIRANLKAEDSVMVLGDSKLVISQVTGRWRLKGGIYYESAIEALEVWRSIEIKNKFAAWIPRELNTIADRLSKVA